MTTQAQKEIQETLLNLSKYGDFRLSPGTMYDIFVNPTETSCNEMSMFQLHCDNVHALTVHLTSLEEREHVEFGPNHLKFKSNFHTVIVEVKPKIFSTSFDCLRYDVKAQELTYDGFPVQNSHLRAFRQKRVRMLEETFRKLKAGTLTDDEKIHLRYYIRNNWRFTHDEKEYDIVNFQLIRIGRLVPKEVTPKPATVSPHVLIVVGSRTLTLEKGRELTEQEFTRLTEVVKALTQ